jgi:hypothetical protein
MFYNTLLRYKHEHGSINLNSIALTNSSTVEIIKYNIYNPTL